MWSPTVTAWFTTLPPRPKLNSFLHTEARYILGRQGSFRLGKRVQLAQMLGRYLQTALCVCVCVREHCDTKQPPQRFVMLQDWSRFLSYEKIVILARLTNKAMQAKFDGEGTYACMYIFRSISAGTRTRQGQVANIHRGSASVIGSPACSILGVF